MTRRSWLMISAIGITTLVAPAAIDPRPRLMWNTTASVPAGLYTIRPISTLRLGDLVAVSPPKPLAEWLSEGGYLPRGVPLLKHVAALPGQRVCRVGNGITIDGSAVGQVRIRDRRGRALPAWWGCRTINPGELFLMNAAAPDSLDGRYLGPFRAATIIGRATPLWTDPSPESRVATQL